MMDGARLLDGLVTTEFSFIQELIWSPPHKNPYPICSHRILSRLKNLSAEWRHASSTTRQSAISLIENLDADIKVLIELRKRCLKLLTCKASTADASTYNVYLAKKVDSILVQHLEDFWNDPSFKLTGTEIQKRKSIDQDCLAADVLPLFLLDASNQGQVRHNDEIAPENFTLPEAGPQANRAREGALKHCSPSQGQSLLAIVGHSAPICEQEPGFHTLTTKTIHGTGSQSAVGATKKIICTSDAAHNSSKGSGNIEEPCVSTMKPDVTPSECDASKAKLGTSIQAQFALASNEGLHTTMMTPEVATDADSSDCSPQSDEDSTATSEAKPDRFSKRTEHMEDYTGEAVTDLQDSPFSSTADEYFSVSSDDEHDSMVGTRVTKNRGYFQRPESAIGVKRAASLMEANGSEISEVQHFPPGAGRVFPGEIEIFSSNKVTDRAQKFGEHDQRKSPFGETPGMTDEVKSTYAKNCSKAEELVEVEMTLRAKICEPESEEPYWNVMFALLNYSNFNVSVQKLEYWSLDKQEDVQCIHWGPGEMILREQPSFLCHNIKVPCSASNTSPRLAFSWQYSKLPEWIPTKDGKPKLEGTATAEGQTKASLIDYNFTCMQKETIRKRSRNMLCFESAEKELKHDRGRSCLKSTKKRTA